MSIAKYVMLAVVGGGVALAASSLIGGKRTIDLGKVVDRTKQTIEGYNKLQDTAEKSGAKKSGDEDVHKFLNMYVSHLNKPPKFYHETFGVAYLAEGAFLGYGDKNKNQRLDQGEPHLFKVEIDEANNRVLISDMQKNTVSHHYHGSGFFSGYMVGTLLNRQRRAGITRDSFASRKVTPRASYKPPASAKYTPRSASARSRARSGGSFFGK